MEGTKMRKQRPDKYPIDMRSNCATQNQRKETKK